MPETPADRAYRGYTTLSAIAIPALVCVLAVLIARAALPALAADSGVSVIGRTWDVGRGQFGLLPALVGTLTTSFFALCIAAPLGLGAAVVAAELAPRPLRAPLAFLLDLLAAIPSVVYGLWALAVVVPLLRTRVMPALADAFPNAALVAGPQYGPSMLAAVLVLAIMILPYISAVAREVLLAVPRTQRDAALALGATRWEMIRDAVLPYARTGLIGGVMLGLGRALGETMAVTMVIGNRHTLPTSLFEPGYTLSSLLANEFGEASAEGHVSALMAAACLLLGVTLLVNGLAQWLVWRTQHGRIGDHRGAD